MPFVRHDGVAAAVGATGRLNEMVVAAIELGLRS